MYTCFDNKTISTMVDGQPVTLSFEEAIKRGVVTQEQLDKDEQSFIEMALRDIEEAGFEDVTDESNKQNKSSHWYVFANAKGVHYCDTIDDVLDLAETL